MKILSKKMINFFNQQLVINQLNNSRCKNIGIISGEANLEYLIWITVKKSNFKDVTLFHINVDNITKKTDKNLTPCAVFLIDKTKKNQEYVKNIFNNSINFSKFDFYY